MNAVEIEEAISELAAEPFDRETFPYKFLEAFGNKSTTIQRLKSRSSNKSDIENGVLQQNNIHMAVCDVGNALQTLDALRKSPTTSRQKAKFILATDGKEFIAEDLINGDVISCEYQDFPNHFGFFLSLAGISTVKQIRENAVDIRATVRLNRLYVELLKTNAAWGSEERRHDMNHFMARLIFCFFAEDTQIFRSESLFTATVEQMSAQDSSNTHEVIQEIFRAMNTPTRHENSPDDRYRKTANIRSWADGFPYVNGGLFSGNIDVPHFSKIARSYLLSVGSLDWKKINPDIFGSMIQAVADDEERGSLGMHYTSVPNILKVLNPLFLNDLRTHLDEAGSNARKLLNLKKRLIHIRVFDPACGSGNFLVIAYKKMREIEWEINKKLGNPNSLSYIPLSNFRGIEIRDFAAEIARLALIIAEYQCNVLYLEEQQLAIEEFLPLDSENWITCGNALRLDWLSICPPTGKSVKIQGDNLFNTPIDQSEINFENEGGETYICGNPPYKGSQTQSLEQKSDLSHVFDPHGISSKQIDYVGGWFMKASTYAQHTLAESAFVSTNSICQGRIVPILWPKIFESCLVIRFAYTSFKWANLASHNAGVTVSIVGLSPRANCKRYLYEFDEDKDMVEREVANITPYLTTGENIVITSQGKSISGLPNMSFGNMPIDGGNLLMSKDEMADLRLPPADKDIFIRSIYGSAEFIRGVVRYCLWIQDEHLARARKIASIRERIERVETIRKNSRDSGTRKMAIRSHQFREMNHSQHHILALPRVSSENRDFLPVGLLDKNSVVTDLCFALYDAPLWNMALIASRLHLVWIATVCGKLKTDFRYSNTLGWNTFPVPILTEKNKTDLTRSAEDILLAREALFPATIADLYAPNNMPKNLRHAHDRNDEVLERIYIGRRFKNDTERLEKLFELYTKMTENTNTTRRKSK